MEENAVFGTNQGQQPVSPNAPRVASSPVQQAVPVPPQMPPATVLPVATPPPPPLSSSFDMGMILKIIAAVVVFVLLLAGGYFFVLPFFQNDEVKPVELTYWGLWESEAVMKPVLEDFHKQYPHITVKYMQQDKDGYRDRLNTRIDNGSGPDVFRFHNSWLPMLLDRLVPLPDDTMSAEEFQNTYYPVAQQDLVRSGAIYGIPSGIDTLALFINTDLLTASGEDPPKSWDDFIRVAKKMTVKEEETGKIRTAGAALGTYDNIQHAPDITSLLMLQNGVNLFAMEQTTTNTTDALSFYTIFAKGTSADDNVWDATLDPSDVAFAKETVGMYFGYSWDIFTIKARNPNLAFKVYPMPFIPQTEKRMSVANYWVDGVSAKTNNQKEALLLLQFLSKKETVQKIYTEASKTRLFGEPYARRDLAETLKNNELVYPFVEQAPSAVSSFFIEKTYDGETGLNTRANAYLGNAVRSILGTTSPETAVGTLIQGVSQILQEYAVETETE